MAQMINHIASIFSDQKENAGIIWKTQPIYLLNGERIELNPDKHWPRGTKQAVAIEACKEIQEANIETAITEYDVKAIITNKIGQTRYQLFGRPTYYRTTTKIVEAQSAYSRLKQTNCIETRQGVNRVIERVEQGQYDHPSVKAFCLGLVYVPNLALSLKPTPIFSSIPKSFARHNGSRIQELIRSLD